MATYYEQLQETIRLNKEKLNQLHIEKSALEK